MIHFEIPHHRTWKPKKLHQKMGKMLFVEPSDSDIQEGNFMAQLWFVDMKMHCYLIQEYDVREKKR